MKEQIYSPNESYIRVATACPEVSVADVETNVNHITDLYNQAADQDTALVVFPELSVTGYTLGDLVQQNALLDQAKAGLTNLAAATERKQTAMIVGLPLEVQNGLYNCAAVLADGEIKGIVPKTHLPTYGEFYEKRWFKAWDQENITLDINGHEVPFGTDCLFDIGGTTTGIEICEDLWVAQPPSGELALNGALLIANPSASPEQIGKATYRRDLVRLQAGKLVAGYLYAGCDVSESTAEIVMGGHQIIAANGRIEAERKPFGNDHISVADIDIEHLRFDRRRQQMANKAGTLIIKTEIERTQEDLVANIERNPFLPNESFEARAERLESALQIQANGLARRMIATHQERLVLGLSGGLDSTLALLVAHKAATILGRDPHDMIHTITMPGPASSEGTQNNAQILAEQLGVQNVVKPIGELVKLELTVLGHDGITQDITYENVQARARTNLLFNYGNQHGTMVLGTGDLSEIALGWCTYNGDQQSHYNVNASIPKTLVKHLVAHAARQAEYQAAQTTLDAILDTVVSPELTKSDEATISQSTEDLIGPYELHDFFLNYLVRWGDQPKKIGYLAEHAFGDDYNREEIHKWLEVFLKRFATNQFKRDNMPNGPKVGSVSLSPRGDWRMPSDLYNAALWQ